MLKSLNSTNTQNTLDIINGRGPFGRNGGGPPSDNNRLSSTSGQVGINLANISYNDTSNELLREEVSEVQMTVGDIAVSLKEVFYINDLVLVNKALAGKLVKCNLSGSHLMVRAKKEELFDSSEQITLG